MNKSPFFSIVTVSLNAASDLRETLESVHSQTFDDFEYIVIDGASSDETGSVIERFADMIDIAVSEPDDGVYHAMNKAIERASGDYVYFLNAGDVLLHEKVLELVAQAIMSSGDVGVFVGSGIRCSKETGNLIFLDYAQAQFDLEFFRHRTINHQCVFAQRRLFASRMFDLKYRLLADYYWLIATIVADHVSVEYRNIGVVRYLHEGMSNQNYDVYLDEKSKVLSEFQHLEHTPPDSPPATRSTVIQWFVTKVKNLLS